MVIRAKSMKLSFESQTSASAIGDTLHPNNLPCSVEAQLHVWPRIQHTLQCRSCDWEAIAATNFTTWHATFDDHAPYLWEAHTQFLPPVSIFSKAQGFRWLDLVKLSGNVGPPPPKIIGTLPPAEDILLARAVHPHPPPPRIPPPPSMLSVKTDLPATCSDEVSLSRATGQKQNRSTGPKMFCTPPHTPWRYF